MKRKDIIFTPTLSQLLDKYKDRYEYQDMDIPVSTSLLERIFNEIEVLQLQLATLSSNIEGSWARYDDTQYTSASPYTLVQDNEVVIPNNGGFSITTHAHTTVPFYDSATQKIQVENEADTYAMTIAFKAKVPNANSTYFEMKLASTGSTPYERLAQTVSFPKGNDVEHVEHFMFQFYADADFVANGNQWNIVSRGGNGVIYDVIYFIQRVQKHTT